MGQSGVAATEDGSAGRGGLPGRRARRPRLRARTCSGAPNCRRSTPASRSAGRDRRRRTSCSSRSITRRSDSFGTLTCTPSFPFPRAYEARVIDHLREAGAKVIAIDIQFTQPTDPTDDQDLAEAIERAHGKVVLAATEVAANGETKVFGGNQVLRELGTRAASAWRRSTQMARSGASALRPTASGASPWR